DRIVSLTPMQPPLQVYDVDGDGRADLFRRVNGGERFGLHLYRSGTGKDARTRSFDLYDSDRYYPVSNGAGQPAGPMNDSTGQYDMLPVPVTVDDIHSFVMVSGSE